MIETSTSTRDHLRTFTSPKRCPDRQRKNDAVADDAIRYGDNDRIAALVANLLRADLLVLLTDTPGVLTADPRD